MNILKEIWWAIRHGDWECGFQIDQPQCRFDRTYYDGEWACLQLGQCWIAVHY